MADASIINNKQVTTSTTSASTELMFFLTRSEGIPSFGKAEILTSGRVVRRPLGLNFKKNTYAYIEVLRTDENGQLVPLAIFNENNLKSSQQSVTGSAIDSYSNNFLIQVAQESREEKYQVVETFGSNFVFFFGERPRYLDVSGILMNSNSHRWKREWLLNYEAYLRGTKAVENRSIVNLHIDNVTISGYLLSCTTSDNAAEPRRTQFQFRMIVTDYVFDEEFTGDIKNGLTPFSINVEKQEEDLGNLVPEPTEFEKAIGNLVEGTSEVLSKIQGVTQSLPAQLATNLLTQAMFGDPLSIITTGAAGAASLYRLMENRGIDSLLEDDNIRNGLGSLVEYNGRPPELIPLNPDSELGQSTLGAAGAANLVASVDNSLNVLLSLKNNPVLRMLEVVQESIEKAVNFFGAKAQLGLINKISGLGGPSGGALVGRFMGFDMVMPFGEVEIVTVGAPQRGAGEGTAEEKANNGSYGSPDYFDVDIVSVPPEASSVSVEIKNSSAYNSLPRVWKLKMEKEPDVIEEKFRSLLEAEEDGTFSLVISKQTEPADLQSNLSELFS